jgi:TonB family protein
MKLRSIACRLVIANWLMVASTLPSPCAVSENPTSTGSSTQQRIAKLEESTFGTTHANLPMLKRLDALESEILGTKHSADNLMQRLTNLEAAVGSPSKHAVEATAKESSQTPAKVETPQLSAPMTATADLTSTLADAVSAYDKKQIEKARDLFEKVLQIDPNSVDANYSLGCIAEDRGDFKHAQLFYQKAADKKPDDTEIATALKNVLEKVKQSGQKEVLSDDVSKATSEFRLGHYSAARTSLEKIVAANPSNDRAHFALAECFKHLQDRTKAVAHFKEAVRLKPDNEIYKKELAQISSRNFDTSGSSNRGEIVPIDGSPAPRRIDSVSWEARNLIAEGRKIIYRLLEARASSNTVEISNAEFALKNMRRSAPDPHAEIVDQLLTYHSRGMAAAKQGLLGDALVDYRKAFSLNPWDFDETLDLVRLEIQNKDWTMAQQHCMAAIACQPDSAGCWLDLGLILLHKQEAANAGICFAVATDRSGSDETAVKFLRQAVQATTEQSMQETLTNALNRAVLSQKMALIDVKNIPESSVIDPLMTAYKAALMMKVADKWQPDIVGTILVLTLDKAGQVTKAEVVKSSGSSSVDERAVNLVKAVDAVPLPGWSTDSEHQFVINFDKIKKLSGG